MRNSGGELVRLQLDIPLELNKTMEQLKRLEQHEKGHVLAKAVKRQEESKVFEAKGVSYVRIQVDVPKEIAEYLAETKTREGLTKRYLVKKALEDLFRQGKAAL